MKRKSDSSYDVEDSSFAEFCHFIEKMILMCDNNADLIKMACVLTQTSKTIFDNVLGESGRKEMFKDLV